MVRQGIQIVTGKISETPGRTAMDAMGTDVAKGTVGAGGVLTDLFAFGTATKILVRGIAAELAATGNAASYIAIQFADDDDIVEIKRVTGEAPKIEWSGNWIDTGRIFSEVLVGRICVYASNAGAANKQLKIVFNIEKVA